MAHSSAGLLLLVALLPVAAAQTLTQPIEGDYDEVYVVAGRAIDSNGEPVAGGRLTVELDMPGVQAAPVSASANCKGDFITYFTLRRVDARGSVSVTLQGDNGSATQRASLDPFFRRSDLVVELGEPWGRRCDAKQDVWEISASVAARVLNRTEPYEVEGVAYEARPYDGFLRLRWRMPDGSLVCPPLPNGPPDACQPFKPDERGDIRYTFTMDRELEAGGTMTLVLEDGRGFNLTVDPRTRLATGLLEASGQGAPPPVRATPAPGAPALLALVALVVVARRLLPRDPR